MHNKFLVWKCVVFFLSFIALSMLVYFLSITPLQGNLPVWNMPELGRADWDVMIYKTYDYFVRSDYFLFALPILPLLFTIMFTKLKSKRVVFLGALGSLVLWVCFWEIFFRVKTNVFVLQYFLEGNYSSQSVFFDGLGSFFMFPLLSLLGLVLSVVLGVVWRRRGKSN